MSLNPTGAGVFLTAVVLMASAPAWADDDPVICAPAVTQWSKTDRSSIAAIDGFLAKAPAECSQVRNSAERVRKSLQPPAPAKAATPAPASPAAPAGPTVYQDGNFRFELTSCKRQGGGAECTASVTPSRKISWFFTNRDHLIDGNGASIPATSLSVGGNEKSVASLHTNTWQEIEAGLKTQIIFRFDGPVDPANVQALVIAIGAPLTGRTATLKPVPWN